MAAKLILVSNREPFLIRRGSDSSVQTQRVLGGLMGALEPAMATVGGSWISWSGFEREAPKQGEALPDRMTLPIGHRTVAVRRIPLSEREASLYFYGFASRTLWPLMHHMLGRVQFDAEAWRAYKRVNQRFADAVLEAAEPDDRIWVHDYHLALVPALIRAARPDARIGFSWHVPWAAPELVRALPWHREILEGILAADQVGVALPRYVRQLVGSCEELLGVPVERNGDTSAIVQSGGRSTRVGAFLPGCDFDRWSERARAARGGRAVRLRRNLVAERLALAVDRLDHTRGMVERLRAVERFFDRYPSWRGRLVFCQIAVPSRTRVEEYREMKKEVDGIVERINQRFAQGSWLPVRYLYRSFEPDELAVYYAASDVMMSTPLADGVSFVPFEYVASRTREDGALLCSSLAGAADAFPEATHVNPYDDEEVAGALHAILEAKPEETRARMKILRERARAATCNGWLETFFRASWNDEVRIETPSAQPEAAAAPVVEPTAPSAQV
jgi:trehalose-6-phosphate synthase